MRRSARGCSRCRGCRRRARWPPTGPPAHGGFLRRRTPARRSRRARRAASSALEISRRLGQAARTGRRARRRGRPVREIVLRAGSIGSAGALLEVAASGARRCAGASGDSATARSRACRLKDGAAAARLRAGRVVVHALGRDAENEPALYVRERIAARSRRGAFTRRRCSPSSGFEIASRPEEVRRRDQRRRDPGVVRRPSSTRSRARHPLPAVTRSRASREGAAPALRGVDRGGGVFAVVLADPRGGAPPSRDRVQTARRRGSRRRARGGRSAGPGLGRRSARGSIPQTAVVHGAGRALRRRLRRRSIHWTPRARSASTATAEQELAAESLPGVWVDRTERADARSRAIPGRRRDPVRRRRGVAEPRGGSRRGPTCSSSPEAERPPVSALTLRGPTRSSAARFRCAPGAAGEPPICRIDGDGRRSGAWGAR